MIEVLGLIKQVLYVIDQAGHRRSMEEEHRHAERKYWRRSTIVSVVTVFIASVASWFAYEAMEASRAQATAAQQQLGAMLNDQRAWIKPTVTIAGDIEYKPGLGTLLPIIITAENVGHEPAFNVFATAWSDIEGGQQLGKKGDERCHKEAMNISKNPGYGVIMFPGDKVNLDPPEVGLLAGWLRSDVAKLQQQQKAPISEVNFQIFGCIVYKFGDDRSYHYSSFWYRVGHTIQIQGLGDVVSFFLPVDSSILKNSLILEKTVSSSGTD